MPFQSEKQRKYLWVHHPEIAKRWAHKYGSQPEKSKIQSAARSRLKKSSVGKKKS